MKRLIAKFKRIAKFRSSSGSKRLTIPDASVIAEVAAQQPEPEPKPPKPIQNAPLEDLPAEVRRHLLTVLDVSELKALVRASPTFHQQYLFDRNYLLRRSLENTLGSVMFDAYACQLFHSVDLDEFLQLYAERACLPPMDEITQETVVTTAAFHINYVIPVVNYFANLALENLASLTKNPREDIQDAALSRSEVMRFTRAAYRLQLLSHQFEYCSEHWLSRPTRGEEFFIIPEPWETEELFSFYQFARHVYQGIFKEIHDDLHPNNPRFDDQGRAPTPEGAFELGDTADADYNLEGITLRGLRVLHTVLFSNMDHEHLVSYMQKTIVKSFFDIESFTGFLGTTQQDTRRERHPSNRHSMQDARVPLPFPGDGEPSAPPLAWTMMWSGTYSNLYGHYIDDDIRCWGYVFWDAARLERTGGKGLLEQQWEKWCEGEDFRYDDWESDS